MGIFSFFKKTTSSWWSSIKNLFSSSNDFKENLEKLEEMLILGDVGVETTEKLISKLNEFIKKENDCDGDKIYNKLVEIIKEIIDIKNEEKNYKSDELNVIIISGVNGVGKTTSIGKIANLLKKKGNKVLIGAGDTFRAGAVEQLQKVCDKINVDVIKGEENSSPSTVTYKTLSHAKENNYNIVLLDTAGRLHNKQNLMNELSKINRSINNFVTDDNNIEKWLVLDGTMGQNIFNQIEEFNKISNITGLIITKTDSISKFGFIIGIIDKYKIPIKYIGTGEKIEDIENFDQNKFIEGLLSE